MEQFLLTAQKREVTTRGGVKKIRRDGNIPAILYGSKFKATPITVKEKDVEKIAASQVGLNTLISLSVDSDAPVMVLIRDYQAHPLHRRFTHLDFQAIDATKKLMVEVPIKLIGLPVGVKEGGILDHHIRRVQVECLPTNIPESFSVDVSNLKIGEGIHVRDLVLPEGVRVLKEAEHAVATVVPPTREEEVAAPAEGVEGAEVPLVGEVKEGEAPKEGEKAEAKKEEGAAKDKTAGKDKAAVKEKTPGKDKEAK